MNYFHFRPLVWSRPVTPPHRRRSRDQAFAVKWAATQAMLRLELDLLDAHNVVLSADFTEADLKADGMPHVRARPLKFPGVEISFDSVHGSLAFGTDAHEFWQHNVRAIALALQALRAVDRYGVSSSGEQYTGWRVVASGENDRERAARYLARHGAPLGTSISRATDRILASRDAAHAHYCEAAKRLHPDAGGSPEAFALLQKAKSVLAV